MGIMKRYEIINQIIKDKKYQSYFEIGIGDGFNYEFVQCDEKMGVDPNAKESWEIFSCTSDDFFNRVGLPFDLIFIDGLHHADQVERDIVNSWNRLNKGGMILLHDIKPENEQMTYRPRQEKVWTGDVYRAWHGLQIKYPKLKLGYIEDEYGIGTITKTRHKIEVGFVSDITFKEYYENKIWIQKF